jgi:hypothetical protein
MLAHLTALARKLTLLAEAFGPYTCSARRDGGVPRSCAGRAASARRTPTAVDGSRSGRKRTRGRRRSTRRGSRSVRCGTRPWPTAPSRPMRSSGPGTRRGPTTAGCATSTTACTGSGRRWGRLPRPGAGADVALRWGGRLLVPVRRVRPGQAGGAAAAGAGCDPRAPGPGGRGALGRRSAGAAVRARGRGAAATAVGQRMRSSRRAVAVRRCGGPSRPGSDRRR